MSQSSQRLQLRMVREFDASPQRVYRAWSDPQDLARWAWGSLGHDVTAEADVRVGGRYRITTVHPKEGVLAFTGTYLEVDDGKKLTYTVQWEAPMGYGDANETVSVEFADRDGRTEAVFVHEGAFSEEARRVHEVGWANTFDMLNDILKGSTDA